MPEEKSSNGCKWSEQRLKAGDLDVLIKDVFLLPFHASMAVILMTHFFISVFLHVT